MDQDTRFTEPDDNIRWSVVTILIIAGIVGAFQFGKIPGAIPVIREEFGISLFAVSWIISLITAIGATTGVVMGALGDRIGYRRLIGVGLVLLTFGCVFGGFSSGIEFLLISRFIEGVGFFFIVLSVPSLIARIVSPKYLRFILSIWSAYMPTGIVIMLFLSSLIMDTVGWRGLWHINGLICLFVLLLFAILTGKMKNKQAHMRQRVNIWGNIKKTISIPGPFLLALCFLCYGGQWMALMNLLPTFFVENLGSTKGSAAALTAFAVIFNIPGNILGGWLTQKNIPRWCLLSFAFTVVTLTTLGIYSNGTPQIIRIILLIIFSFIGGIMPGTLISGVPVHSPGEECLGTTNGVMTQGSNIGTLIMPPALALVVSAMGGWHMAPWLFVITGLIGISASLGIRKLEK